jgi:DNA polymerase III subunit gamma/tau
MSSVPLPWEEKPKTIELSIDDDETSEFKLVARGKGPFRTKYRPQKLSELVPTCSLELLKNQIDNPGSSQIYLFEGKTGTGKTTCARILAKASACLADNSLSKPCLTCKNCQNYEKSYDKIELNAANQNKVDDIRQLVEDMRYSPSAFPKKIYILDEVQRCTDAGQQVLLAEVEEPYPYLLIFLCTTDIKNINKALVDRACRITFNSLLPSQSGEIIRQITKKEGLTILEDDYEKFHHYSNGSVRALLNLLENYKDNGNKIDFSLLEEQGVPGEVKNIFKLIKEGEWEKLLFILNNFKTKKNAETLRIGMQNYIRGTILRTEDISEATIYAKVLEEMNKPPVGDTVYDKYNNFVVRCTKTCNFFANK